jgi:hypothetical protein
VKVESDKVNGKPFHTQMANESRTKGKAPNDSPVHNQVFARFKITRWQTLLVEASRGAMHEQRRHLIWRTLNESRGGSESELWQTRTCSPTSNTPLRCGFR